MGQTPELARSESLGKQRGSDNGWSSNFAVSETLDFAPESSGQASQDRARQGTVDHPDSAVQPILCAVCSKPLTKRWQKRACSKSCAARLTPIRPQAGALNGNYKGGISTQRSRYVRAFYLARPDVLRAQRAAKDAIRRGFLVRPAQCSQCDKPCYPDAHHPDYTQPLLVEWLCRRCHCAKNSPRKDRRAGVR